MSFFCCCTIWKLFFTTFLVARGEVLHDSLSTKIRTDASAWLLLAAGTLFTCQMSEAWVSLEVYNLYFLNKKCRNCWYFGICSACSFCSWTLDGAGTFCLVVGNGYGILSWIVWVHPVKRKSATPNCSLVYPQKQSNKQEFPNNAITCEANAVPFR